MRAVYSTYEAKPTIYVRIRNGKYYVGLARKGIRARYTTQELNSIVSYAYVPSRYLLDCEAALIDCMQKRGYTLDNKIRTSKQNYSRLAIQFIAALIPVEKVRVTYG